MRTNPFLLMPSAAVAWAEGFVKGYASQSSPEPSENIAEEDYGAFNQGVDAGVESAKEGLALEDPCIPASEEHGPGHTPATVINAGEIAHGVWELRHLKSLAGGVAGILVAALELAVTLPVHTLPPEEVLPNLVQPVIDKLAS